METGECARRLWVTFVFVFTISYVSMGSASLRVATRKLQVKDTLVRGRVEPKQTSRKKVPCFEDQCMCYSSNADCNNRSMTYIPKPNYTRTIRNLYFSYNRLTNISRDDFFANVTELRALHLQHNGLEAISPGAFRLLPKLVELYLDNNRLTFQTLTPVFSAKALRRLYVRNTRMGPMPPDYFFRLPVSRLSVLDLSQNFLRRLNFTTFRPLSHLRNLSVSNNRIIEVVPDVMPELSGLKIANNALYDFLKTCATDGSSLFPELTLIDFTQNGFTGFGNTSVCLPKLRTLTMSKNQIVHLEADMFGERRFPSLWELNVGFMPSIRVIDAFAFNSSTLAVLGIVRSAVKFSDASVNPRSFGGLPRLTQLQASHNFLADLSDDKFMELFGSISSLNKLYLGQCEIQAISRRTFSTGFQNLTRLYLHRNKLIDLPDGAFDSLRNLTTLTLGLNQLRTVRESLFSPHLQGHLHTVDLSGNPFVCDCDLLWFKNWFLRSRRTFKQYSNYTCHNLADTALKDFVLRDAVCVFSHDAYKAMISTVVIFSLLLLALGVVYQYRWHIRLKMTFRSRGDPMRQRLQSVDCHYDIYLSSAEEDRGWVVQDLLPFLEEKLQLRVCYLARDGDPKLPDIKNIEDGLAASRRILAVFSRHFAQDPLCQFELDVCLSQVVDYHDQLIVTCLGDVTSCDLTPTMMAVMNTTLYLQWVEGEERRGNRDVFWDRLRFCLRSLLQDC